MNRIVIAGSGNVAEALAVAVHEHPALQLVQLVGRNAARLDAIAALTGNTPRTTDPAATAEADIYLVAVSDRAVGEVAAALRVPPGAIVAHTAGCVPVDALPQPRRGVLYPLQTFTRGRRIDLSAVPLFIEGSSPEVTAALERFARQLSQRVLPADSARRERIHLAGVLVNNFVNALYGMGAEAIGRVGLPFEVLKPLIAETAAKAAATDTPAAVQTGPAVRGDRTTQERHAALLADDGLLTTIYQSISRYIWETSRKI